MMDDEIGRLMVVNKMVCEYCVSEWYYYYITKFIYQNVFYHVLKLYYVIHIFIYLFVYLNCMIAFHICFLSVHFIDISCCCI